MEWFTLEWLMKNLEWAVGLLVIGCIILFFFSNSFRMAIKTRCTKKRKEIRRGCFTANSYSYNYFFICYNQRDYQVKKRTKKDIKIDTSYASRY